MSLPIHSSYTALVAMARLSGEAKLLLLKRTNGNYWCHIAGRIEKGETAWQAAIRELKEETAIEVDAVQPSGYVDQFYDIDRDCINIVPVFVARVNAGSTVVLNEEHSEFKWCSLEEAKALVDFPNMRALYDFIWRHFVEDSRGSVSIRLEQ